MRVRCAGRRAVWLFTMAAILVAAMVVPAVGSAGPPALPLTIGVSTPGTLTVTPDSKVYFTDYSVALSAGQTIAATYTPSAAITQPAMAVWAPFGTDIWMLTRNIDGQDPRKPTTIYLLAPRTAVYNLRVAGQSVAGTYTIDAATVPALDYSLLPMDAPTYAARNHWFKVTVTLKGTFDQLVSPVTIVVQRKVGRWWRAYSTTKPLFSIRDADYATAVTMRANLRLPEGTFRTRAVFSDAAHPKAQYNAWRNVTIGSVDLTELPSGMDPKSALKTYLQDVLDKKYVAAYALLPPVQKRSYGTAKDFGTQVGQYGITGYKMGPARRQGQVVTIVAQQDTPAMDITYTWTYVRLAGSWFVKSRSMGGSI